MCVCVCVCVCGVAELVCGWYVNKGAKNDFGGVACTFFQSHAMSDSEATTASNPTTEEAPTTTVPAAEEQQPTETAPATENGPSTTQSSEEESKEAKNEKVSPSPRKLDKGSNFMNQV